MTVLLHIHSISVVWYTSYFDSHPLTFIAIGVAAGIHIDGSLVVVRNPE
jgi:hypothetical protein